jgi:hypothetical protein
MRIDKAVAPLSNPRTPKDVDRLYVSPVAIVKLVTAPVFEIDPVVEELVSVVPLKVNTDPVAKALVLVAYATPFVVYPVPDVWIVPPTEGSVIVTVTVSAGCSVVEPDVAPAKTIDAILFP